MSEQSFENLSEPVRKKRRFIRAGGVFSVAWAGVCLLSALGILFAWPVVSDLFGTNPRAAIVVAVIGAVSLVMGVLDLRQANDATQLKEMTYGESDERYQLIRAKAGSAFGLFMFGAVPLVTIALKLAGFIDIEGMTVLMGMLVAGGVVWLGSLAYYQRRL